MKIENNEEYEFVLTEVFSPIILKTKKDVKNKIEPEEFSICMRDTGFEFKYNNEWWEAKNGVISKIGNASQRAAKTCDDFVNKVLNNKGKWIMLTKIEAVWSDSPSNEDEIIYLKNIDININLVSEKYTTEQGEKIIVMASGNEYIVKDFKFLE